MEVEEKLQEMVKVKENFQGTYQKLKVLNKFYLYSSLSKHAEQV
jgi:hypothetical protein